MRTGREPMKKKTSHRLSWPDAAILGGAVLGLLLGVSLLNFQAAVALGVAALAFVIYKLLTTQP